MRVVRIVSYLNSSVEECKKNGNHLKSVDSDGFCNACGFQKPECDNCGMIEVPLKEGHCEGCICLKCKRGALECGSSMNAAGWCNSCEATFQQQNSDLYVAAEPTICKKKYYGTDCNCGRCPK